MGGCEWVNNSLTILFCNIMILFARYNYTEWMLGGFVLRGPSLGMLPWPGSLNQGEVGFLSGWGEKEKRTAVLPDGFRGVAAKTVRDAEALEGNKVFSL